MTVNPDRAEVVGGEKVQFPLDGIAGGRKLVRLVPDKLDGELSVKLDGKAGSDTDSVVRKLTRWCRNGFPRQRAEVGPAGEQDDRRAGRAKAVIPAL